MTAALDGLRVVELVDETGEWAGKLFADMGADVVKVEPPGGARTRRIGPFAGDVEDPERSLHFWNYNTSKRSVTLDRSSREGRGLLMRLASETDVLIATEQLPLEELAVVNPRLVTCSISPWGPDGPYAGYLSGDLIQMAMGGIVHACGYDDHDIPPVRPGLNHSTHIAGWHAAIGILTSLHARETTGRGQHVEIAIHDCVGVCVEFSSTHWFYARQILRRQTARHAAARGPGAMAAMQAAALQAAGGTAVQGRTMVQARDGRYINAPVVDATAFEWFAAFAEGAGVDVSTFRDDHGGFVRGAGLQDAIRAIAGTLDSTEIWLAGQSLGMTWAAIRHPEDWIDDPHAEERGFFHDVDYPQLGRTVRQQGPPFAFTAHPGLITRAPFLGEHNDEVYGPLGYSSDDLAALRSSGVI